MECFSRALPWGPKITPDISELRGVAFSRWVSSHHLSDLEHSCVMMAPNWTQTHLTFFYVSGLVQTLSMILWESERCVTPYGLPNKEGLCVLPWRSCDAPWRRCLRASFWSSSSKAAATTKPWCFVSCSYVSRECFHAVYNTLCLAASCFTWSQLF